MGSRRCSESTSCASRTACSTSTSTLWTRRRDGAGRCRCHAAGGRHGPGAPTRRSAGRGADVASSGTRRSTRGSSDSSDREMTRLPRRSRARQLPRWLVDELGLREIIDPDEEPTTPEQYASLRARIAAALPVDERLEAEDEQHWMETFARWSLEALSRERALSAPDATSDGEPPHGMSAAGTKGRRGPCRS